MQPYSWMDAVTDRPADWEQRNVPQVGKRERRKKREKKSWCTQKGRRHRDAGWNLL